MRTCTHIQAHKYTQCISSFAYKLEQPGKKSTNIPQQETCEAGVWYKFE